MSDRTFRFAVTITDEITDTDLIEEFVTFDPHDTDQHGTNERVIEHVEAWLKRAKYDARQLDIEAAQACDSAAERAEHHYRLVREAV